MLNLRRKPVVTPSDLDGGLAALGLSGAEHLIVHASLRSFGQLEGGARGVVDTLAARAATVVAPAFTYGTLLRHASSPVHQRFHRDLRVSRDIGRVPQELVDRADAVRSFHPTLSFIALGQAAEQVTAAQTLASPYQPIGALYDLGGLALMMGVDFGSNTSVHYGEHVAGMPLLTRYVPLGTGVHPTAFPNCSAAFGRVKPHVTGQSVTVGNATLELYRVRDLVDATVRLVTANPEALLCDYSSCRCQEVRRVVRERGLTPRPHGAA
ncbi:AAC(3) family N-acetyltransferase [Deinococcus sp. MIMF12]|uniref:Aminoglycoside N(3)-acetyltransferase n=1 Tax=Deinococcus rhizophilus TaxID=3049544 RepID=A0ABT7JDS6_9DEIO|nr:AAC(3) family N-acetyltransferase [Deinococcus rhizophilus]MDL2343213.1 AAC(3) family N-acetyltransferase [Deinococcus rhizophilus]